jgi:hypothetical protein
MQELNESIIKSENSQSEVENRVENVISEDATNNVDATLGADAATATGADSADKSDERFEVLRQNGLDEPKSYLCPSTTTAGWAAAETGKPLSPQTISYGYFTRENQGAISTSTCGGSSVIAADAQTKTAGTWNHDKKGAYLRIDSSVTRPGGAMWTNEIATSNGIDKTNAEAGLLID